MILGIIASVQVGGGDSPTFPEERLPQIDISFYEIIEIVQAEGLEQTTTTFYELNHI